jgi:hypothetical protein
VLSAAPAALREAFAAPLMRRAGVRFNFQRRKHKNRYEKKQHARVKILLFPPDSLGKLHFLQ